MLNENRKGYIAAITANVIFGINISVTKSLFTENWMTPMGYSVTRLFFGLIVFWTLSFFAGREKTAPRDLLIIIAGGFIGMAVTQLSFFIALQHTTPVIISLISALGPIVVLLLSALFLKDPVTKKKAIGVIIGISGAALVVFKTGSSGASSSSILGIALALVSITGNSFYLIIIRRIAGKYNPLTLMKWMYLTATIVLAPVGISEVSKQRVFSSEATLLAVLQVGYILIFTGIIGLLLIPTALKRIKATSVSMCANFQPLVASMAAILIGQDNFTWDKLIALVLIVSGVFIITQRKPGEII